MVEGNLRARYFGQPRYFYIDGHLLEEMCIRDRSPIIAHVHSVQATMANTSFARLCCATL